MRYVLAAALASAAVLSLGSIAEGSNFRGLVLPDGSAIATSSKRTIVSANGTGTVAANVMIGRVQRIVVWDPSGKRRVLAPPAENPNYDMHQAGTTDAVVGVDGRVYGIGAYPFDGAYIGIHTRLYVWGKSSPHALPIPSCPSAIVDYHPTAIAADGRMAIAGAYDGAIMNPDSIFAGDMAPTANVLHGERCTKLGVGWISAFDGPNAAGYRLYRQGAIIPPNVLGPADGYRAVRWLGSRATELGRGVALGVNARGDCVGANAAPDDPGTFVLRATGPTTTIVNATFASDPRAILWRGSTVYQLSKVRRSIAYAINESGKTIVGTVWDGHGQQHAVRWKNGQQQLLDRFLPRGSTWKLLVAYGITSDGAIYGVGSLGGLPAIFVLGADS